MKSKKVRHVSSSDDSEDSEVSVESISSSESDSGSSTLQRRHHKRKKKQRGNSSESESESEGEYKKSKKKKHKKKKKRHSKKKRRLDSDSDTVNENVSESDDETQRKKKRKHKHKTSKREFSAPSSGKEYSDDGHKEHRLQSIVKERRVGSDEERQPSQTYYRKEYRSPPSDGYEGHHLQNPRFYREPHKEQMNVHYNEQFKYGRQNENRPRNDDRRPSDGGQYQRKPREDFYQQNQSPNRGYNRFNQQEARHDQQRRFNPDQNRDYRDRRPFPDQRQFRERDIQEKRDRFQDEKFQGDRYERGRDIRRDRGGDRHINQPPFGKKEFGGRGPQRDFPRKTERENVDGDREREKSRPNEREKRDRSRQGERERDKSSPREKRSRFADNDNKEYTWGKDVEKKEEKGKVEMDKPNFGLSGKLTADTNTVNGIVLKYSEPDDAKQPKRRWRFYPFKGDKTLPILYIHRQSCFVMGREKKVVDIQLEHPSVSKQHAALQYRATPFTRPDGSVGRRVRPYIIDLDSANGTFVNNKRIDPRRYVELLERDVVKFGFSQRDYVLLHENSKDDAQDDDQDAEIEGVVTVDRLKREKRAKQEVADDGE